MGADCMFTSAQSSTPDQTGFFSMRLFPHGRTLGIPKGQIVLDFGCASGSYIIPAAGIAGDEEIAYALDKDRRDLDELMQKAECAQSENIEGMETTGELKIDPKTNLLMWFCFMMSYITGIFREPRIEKQYYENSIEF